jgi:hypothetical protein
LRVATPLAFKTAVPSEVAPFKNVTVPAGVPPVAADTAAVKVSVCPTVSELAEAESAVVVWATLTVTEIAGDETDAISVVEPL